MKSARSSSKSIKILRWIARIWGLLYLLFFLLFFIGESITSSQDTNPMTLRGGLGLAFVFVYFAGLILAWKWEGTGALIAITFTAAWAVVIQEYSLLTLFMAAPGILFIVCWYWGKKTTAILPSDPNN